MSFPPLLCGLPAPLWLSPWQLHLAVKSWLHANHDTDIALKHYDYYNEVGVCVENSALESGVEIAQMRRYGNESYTRRSPPVNSHIHAAASYLFLSSTPLSWLLLVATKCKNQYHFLV